MRDRGAYRAEAAMERAHRTIPSRATRAPTGSAVDRRGVLAYTINSAGYNICYTRDECRVLWKKISGSVRWAAGIAYPDPNGSCRYRILLALAGQRGYGGALQGRPRERGREGALEAHEIGDSNRPFLLDALARSDPG